MAQDLPKRSEIPVEKQWDAASVYATDEAWEQAFKKVHESLDGLAAFKGTLKQSAKQVANWFEASEEVLKELEKVHLYASLFHNADTSDQEAASKESRARTLYAMVASTIAFFEPELLELIDEKTVDQWINEEPRLEGFQQYFHQLERKRAHIRSAEVEEILGGLVDSFYSAEATHNILADADLTFEPAVASDGSKVPIAQGNIDALLIDPDRELRKSAFDNYSDAFLGFKNSIANCLSTCAKNHSFNAKVRGFNSSLDSALFEDNIPTQVFHEFLGAFKRHLPTWHRYWKVRKKALGLDTLQVWDLKAPLSSKAPVIPFEKSVEWITEGMGPLGKDYVEVMKKGVTKQRWVDPWPSQAKRSGAFSTGTQGCHPFILMSYTDDVFSLSTLAHELGHSMHSYLTWETQPFIYSDYSIFVAEVASNFNQALVRNHLLEQNKDRDFQIAVIEEAMSNFHRYFFIMPILALFELELHERTEKGEGITSESLISLMSDLFREGYGNEVEMDDQRVGITWAQFPIHLYADFYVYQYGTGISAAHALVQRVLEGGDEARENYLEFLKSGSAHYPIDLLKRAGVDLTTPEPVERAFSALGAMVDRIEELLC